MNRLYQLALATLAIAGPVILVLGGVMNALSPSSSSSLEKLRLVLPLNYDLKPKYKQGDIRHARLIIVYNLMNPGGHIVSRHEMRGDLERRVESVLPDGKAYERITWKSMASRHAQGPTGAYGPFEPYPWAENFSYRFSAEDSYDKFHWNYEKFPKTMAGFLAVIHTVDAHFEFDYLRSAYHGSIEMLQKIGDEVEAPDNRQPFTINFPPVVPDSYLQKKNVYTKFIGLTYAGGEPCAILAHRQGPGEFWLDFSTGADKTLRTHITSTFSGNLLVRLSDGILVHGDFVEWVVSTIPVPGSDTPSYRYQRADYNIDEISKEDYLRGIGPSTK